MIKRPDCFDNETRKDYIREIFGLLREAYKNDEFDVRMLDICESAMLFKLTIEPTDTP